MAKAIKKKSKKKATKKTAKKKTIKKVVKKAAKKKTAKKVTKKKTTKTSSPTSKITLVTLNAKIDLLRKDVALLSRVLDGPATITQKTTVAGDVSVTETQTNLFDTPPPKETAEVTFTQDEVSGALQEVMTVAGQDEVKTILTNHSAVRVSEIKESDYASVIEACSALTGNMGQDNTTQETNSATSLF